VVADFNQFFGQAIAVARIKMLDKLMSLQWSNPNASRNVHGPRETAIAGPVAARHGHNQAQGADAARGGAWHPQLVARVLERLEAAKVFRVSVSQLILFGGFAVGAKLSNFATELIG